MRGLTLWQPWASAIALGSKRIETRSWSTAYRGLVAIHASKRHRVDEMLWLQAHWNWCGAMRGAGWTMGGGCPALPRGAIVAIARLVDVRLTDSFTQAELDTRRMPPGETLEAYSWSERGLGDFSLGRYGWVLKDVRPLSTPYPYDGAQGLWVLREDVAAELLALADKAAA